MNETAWYFVVGIGALAAFVAWAFVGGTRGALWVALLFLPWRIVLPPAAGRLVGFENLFLVSDVLVPVTFVVWLVRRMARGPADHAGGRWMPWALPLVFLAFVVSYHPGVNMRDFASDLQKWLSYTLAFVLVSQELRSREDWVRTVNVLLLAGALVTIRDVAGYLRIFTLPEPLAYQPNRDAFQYSGFDVERYQGTGWPFFIYSLFLFIYARITVDGARLADPRRTVLLAYGGLLVGLLLLTLYRGDWLALGAALGASALIPGVLSRRVLGTSASVGAVTVALIGGLWSERMKAGLESRFQSLARASADEHVLARVDAMAIGWAMFRDHPIRGIGLGQYGANFERYGTSQLFGTAMDPSYFRQANNDYVQYLATTGLAGFAALGFLFATFLRLGYKLARALQDRQTRAVVVGCWLSAVGFLVTALSQNPTWDKTYGLLLFTELGMIWAIASTPVHPELSAATTVPTQRSDLTSESTLR